MVDTQLCIGNCQKCQNSTCIYDREMTGKEYDLSRQLDTEILLERQEKPVSMDKHIYNRPDREAYTRERNRILDKRRYSKNPEKFRKSSRERYYRNREVRIAHQIEYYNANREERIVKQREYYEENKETINAKKRQKYAESHPKKPKQTHEERLEKMREYRLKHRDEINRKKREAYHRNKENKNGKD